MNKYDKRKYIIGAIFLLVLITFICKLFFLQVIDSSYKESAAQNVLRKVISYPSRGLIYDRNQKLLVYNKAAYDLLVTPKNLEPFDTTELCNNLDINKKILTDALKKAKRYSYYKPSVILKQLSPEVYAGLQEQLFRYPGFFVQIRTLREYPKKIAAHALGFVGEVNQKTIDNNFYYSKGDYIGVSGLEKAYEKELRGEKGVNFYLVDVHNQIKGSYKNGEKDTSAILGNDLISTIDRDIQEYAEKLMQNKRGAVVAIEPSTGEILCCYSGPSYDPNLLVGRQRGSNYEKLLIDPIKPLTNRAISASYSPGSTFKVLQALIALNEGVIDPTTSFICNGPNSHPIRCTHFHESPIALEGGIRESCNTYFWNIFKLIIGNAPNAEEGYKKWRNYITSFGLGHTIGTELYGESSGNIPLPTYYDHYFGRHHWNALTIRSLSIGQGEVILTPLQMANTTAIIANRGYYITPHLVKSVKKNDGTIRKLHFKKHLTTINPKYFEPVINGMQQVVNNTNTRYTAFVNGITICGKTGTVQNVHGSDNSAFIAFAPKDHPKIAVAVYVEFGIWGARYAAPIASLIIEKYLNDSIQGTNRKYLEQKMFDTNLLNPNQPK